MRRARGQEDGRSVGMIHVLLAMAAGIIPILTVGGCYAASLKLGHVVIKDLLRPITDLKKNVPEAIIFALGYSLASVLQITAILLRFAQVSTFYSSEYSPLMNNAGCLFGLTMAFAQMTVVSIRQSHSSWVQLIGKIVQFSAICVYIAVQAYISVASPRYHSRPVAYFRCLLAILTAACPFTVVAGLNVEILKKYKATPMAEYGIFLFSAIFWLTMSYDFYRNRIAVLRPRCRVRNDSEYA